MYRTGRAFTERDVRFIEAVAGFLAHGLEIHRNRRTLEAENSRLRIHTPAADDIIGGSNAVIHLRQQILRAAPQPFTVLVQGESGSGKELVALALHRNSRRADGPLVVVNCAAIAPTLLEAELFGYKKGAFSGADRDHPGLFQQADEGTLFLDEVGELSLECQAKLLRVIEGKAFRPVGATARHEGGRADRRRDAPRPGEGGEGRAVPPGPPVPAEGDPDPRAAAARAPGGHPRAGRRSSWRRCRPSAGGTSSSPPAAMRKLQAYPWPGNVRQLRAVIESAAVMSENDTLDADALPLTGVDRDWPSAAAAARRSTCRRAWTWTRSRRGRSAGRCSRPAAT